MNAWLWGKALCRIGRHRWPERMHGWAACDRCHKFSLAEEK